MEIMQRSKLRGDDSDWANIQSETLFRGCRVRGRNYELVKWGGAEGVRDAVLREAAVTTSLFTLHPTSPSSQVSRMQVQMTTIPPPVVKYVQVTAKIMDT
jgi:hypothetical protein